MRMTRLARPTIKIYPLGIYFYITVAIAAVVYLIIYSFMAIVHRDIYSKRQRHKEDIASLFQCREI